MKTIYLVRHGESVFNAGTHFEKREAPLTERGRAQAMVAGKRLTHMPHEVIIASPITRTKETAEIIAKETGTPVEHSSLFIERARPSATLSRGLRHDRPPAASDRIAGVRADAVCDRRGRAVGRWMARRRAVDGRSVRRLLPVPGVALDDQAAGRQAGER